MKLEVYTANQVPSGVGSSVHSLGDEHRRPLSIPDTAGAIVAGLDQGAAALSDIALRLARARQVDQLAEAQIATREGFAGIAARFSDPQFLSSTDPADFEKTFDEAAGELQGRIAERVTDPDVRRHVDKDFAGVRLSHLTNVRQQARTVQIDRGRAGTIEQLERLQNLLLKADRAADTKGFADVLGQAESLLAGKTAAGYFSQQEALTEMERFRRRTGATMWTRRIIDNPKAAMEALANPSEQLDEEDRLRLYDRAQNTYESVLRTRIQLAEKAERDAERSQKKTQEAVAAQGWELFTQGKLTETQVARMMTSRQVDLSEGKALLSALRAETRREDAGTNNPMVVGDLAAGIEMGRDVSGDLKAALDRGDIKPATYIEFTRKAADTAYRRGLGYVNSALQPGAADQWNWDKNMRHAEVVSLFNEQVQAGKNPEAASREIVERYLQDRQRTAAMMPAPLFLRGAKEKSIDLEAAKTATVDAFRQGRIDAGEYDRESRLIDQLLELATDRAATVPADSARTDKAKKRLNE